MPTLGAVSDMAKTGKRSSVPPLDPAELDLDAEDSSDGLPIVFDDERVRPSESVASPTLSSDPVATDALSVLKPIPLPSQLQQRPADGMRWGAIVAVGGLLALSLGGLSAYLVLDGDETPSTPASSPSPVAEATPPAKGPAGPAEVARPETETPPTPGSGRVEVRAVAGARVEVDGEDRGEAPVPLDLPVGEHRVGVTAPNHHPWQTTIDVKAGANAAVTAELVPMEAATPPPEPKSPGETKRPRPGPSKPKPDAKPDAKASDSKPKPKPDVFMDSSKGKDDGIFLPVGGK
jgi:hypothetical protein